VTVVVRCRADNKQQTTMASTRVSAADAGGSPEARWSRESQRIGGGEGGSRVKDGVGDSDDDRRQRQKSDSSRDREGGR
jgi:hypothetical protein